MKKSYLKIYLMSNELYFEMNCFLGFSFFVF